MASAAHVASTDSTKPSLFEVIAQERLTQLLPAAMTHVTNLIVNRYPVLATYISPDKFVYSAHTALEMYFLVYHRASAGEYFYGLERVNKKLGFTRSDRVLSLQILCLLPLLKNKLAKSQEEDHSNDSQWLKLAWKLYPYFCAGLQTLDFVINIRYLLGRTEFHSLEQVLSGTFLRRARVNDETSVSRYRIIRIAGSVLTYSVTASVFFIQFLQWWTNRSSDADNDEGSVIPDPPVHLHSESSMCPLCLNEIVNPAVLATSGYTFCYPCVYLYLNQANKCPVTGYPSYADDLIRLHSSGS